jgi:hypothetical protein
MEETVRTPWKPVRRVAHRLLRLLPVPLPKVANVLAFAAVVIGVGLLCCVLPLRRFC